MISLMIVGFFHSLILFIFSFFFAQNDNDKNVFFYTFLSLIINEIINFKMNWLFSCLKSNLVFFSLWVNLMIRWFCWRVSDIIFDPHYVNIHNTHTQIDNHVIKWLVSLMKLIWSIFVRHTKSVLKFPNSSPTEYSVS